MIFYSMYLTIPLQAIDFVLSRRKKERKADPIRCKLPWQQKKKKGKENHDPTPN